MRTTKIGVSKSIGNSLGARIDGLTSTRKTLSETHWIEIKRIKLGQYLIIKDSLTNYDQTNLGIQNWDEYRVTDCSRVFLDSPTNQE